MKTKCEGAPWWSKSKMFTVNVIYRIFYNLIMVLT